MEEDVTHDPRVGTVDERGAAGSQGTPDAETEGTRTFALHKIRRGVVLEHPLLGPRLERLYGRAREKNTTLPDTLEKFIDEDIKGERGAIVKGRVKWQAALTRGLHQARADAWQKTAKRKDRERAKEMSGD